MSQTATTAMTPKMIYNIYIFEFNLLISYNIIIEHLILKVNNMLDENIFKAYDIRGVYPDELNEESAKNIGRAFIKYTHAKTVLVGEDARVSTPALRKAILSAIQESGANIIFANQLTTPMFYFAVVDSKVDAGIMITASHNPGKYNGFKMVWGDATPIGEGSGMEEIKKLAIENIEIKKSKNNTPGEITKIDIKEKYIKKILSLVRISEIKSMKISVDAGNGMAGIILPRLLKQLPQLNVENLFFDIDMSFPNHEANPVKEETLKTLKKSIEQSDAHFGVAYDGDADRIGFLDENGEFIRSDFIFCAILPKLLSKYPESAILYDLRCSKILPEEIKRLGGKPLMTRVGHAFIKKQLSASNGAGAAELSSHFYFKDFYGVECSDLMLLYLLIIVSENNKPLSKIIAPFKKYMQSGEINFEVKNKNKKITEIKNKYGKKTKNYSNIDGIRLEFEEDGGLWWWFNVRASNTEPLLRLNIEANNKDLLEKKLAELTEIIEK